MSKKYSATALCLIWLDSFIGLEYKHKQELFGLIKDKIDISKVISLGKDYIVSSVGENAFNTIKNAANNVYLDYVLDGLEKRKIVAVTILDENYPEFLKETPVPPLVLYTKGDIELLKSQCFAVVGSRKCPTSAKAVAENYANELIKSGFTLVTGSAEGIDQTVLETAVKNGSKAISVVAGGIDNVYPKSNVGLLDKLISGGGLVIAEYPPEVIPQPYHFPVRNRIIAALSVGVLIVSGGLKSGTMYTAEYAGEYGKDIFAVPYGIGVAAGAGCNELIKKQAHLTDSPLDILEFYGKKPVENSEELTEAEKEVLDKLFLGETHIEKLCQALNKQIYQVSPILSMLEIKGLIYKNGNAFGATTIRRQ